MLSRSSPACPGRSGARGRESETLHQPTCIERRSHFLVVVEVAEDVARGARARFRRRNEARVVDLSALTGRTVVYAALALTAYRVVAGTPTSSAQQQQSAAAGVMAHPFGRTLVAVAGLAVLAIGIGLAVYGAKRMFEKRLMLIRMRPATRQAARRLGQAGYIAKGVAFAIVGLLLVDAAATDNPAKSRGLDAALRTLVAQPFGKFLLLLVAIGFAAFGIYCFFQSRYRKVTT